MKLGICPKCKSSEVYHQQSFDHRGFLPISWFQRARLEDYVCTTCGFTESYIIKKSSLEITKRKWQRQMPK